MKNPNNYRFEDERDDSPHLAGWLRGKPVYLGTYKERMEHVAAGRKKHLPLPKVNDNDDTIFV